MSIISYVYVLSKLVNSSSIDPSDIISLIFIYFLYSFGYSMIFKKAGLPAEKGLIPIYSDYIAFSISCNGYVYLALLAICIIELIFPSSSLMIILWIGTLIIRIIYCYFLSDSFGKNIGFSIGLFFLEPIFLLILGKGESEYIGNASKKNEKKTLPEPDIMQQTQDVVPAKSHMKLTDRIRSDKKLKNTLIAVVGVIIVASISCFIIHDKLILNGNKEITLYAGQSSPVDVISTKGNSYENMTWTSSDNKAAIVGSDGVVKGVSAGDAVISAKAGFLKNGSCNVKVKYKKVSVRNAQVLKKPAGERLAQVIIKLGQKSDAYVYLKCLSNSHNSMSFYVKENHKAKVLVPLGKYRLYAAEGGTEWYGRNYLFGNNTNFFKMDKFTCYEKGNYVYGMTYSFEDYEKDTDYEDEIDGSDFPDPKCEINNLVSE